MLFLLAFNAVLLVVLSMLYMGLLRDTPLGDALISPYSLIATQFFGLLAPMLIFKKISGRKFSFKSKKVTWRFPGSKNLILVILIAFTTQPYMILLSIITPAQSPGSSLFESLSAIPWPVALLLVALVPALCEEIVFRDFMLNQTLGYNLVTAALINGIYFGLIHMNLQQLPYAAMMGVVLFLVAAFTRSVLSAVILHFIVNASQFALGTFLSGLDEAGMTIFSRLFPKS